VTESEVEQGQGIDQEVDPPSEQKPQADQIHIVAEPNPDEEEGAKQGLVKAIEAAAPDEEAKTEELQDE
jgi:hypothetical protein